MPTDIVRLTLRECARLLSFKDKRSARRWCNNHAVAILSDVGAKTPYVLKTEFEAAKLRLLIPYFKSKYGVDWKQALTTHQAGDIVAIVGLTQQDEKCCVKKVKNCVIGKNASRFYSTLTAVIFSEE